MKFIDLSGSIVGKLSVLNSVRIGRRRYYKCVCACGKEVFIRSDALSANNPERTQSCGCVQKEKAAQHAAGLRRTHGASKSREYITWKGLKQRCYNPKATGFKYWGGRGIKVCARWRRSFTAFLKDMGLCPKGLTIERRKNDGDYKPSNCYWADRVTQAKNSRHRNQWN